MCRANEGCVEQFDFDDWSLERTTGFVGRLATLSWTEGTERHATDYGYDREGLLASYTTDGIRTSVERSEAGVVLMLPEVRRSWLRDRTGRLVEAGTHERVALGPTGELAGWTNGGSEWLTAGDVSVDDGQLSVDVLFEGIHLGRYVHGKGFERELVDLRGGQVRGADDVGCSLGFGVTCAGTRRIGGHPVVHGRVLTRSGRVYLAELGQFD